MFIGEYSVKLDAKNRMTMPARYRDELRAMCGGDMNVTLHPEGYLLLFPRPKWMAFAQGLINAKQDMRWLKRIFLGNAAELTIDGAGRVALPAQLVASGEAELGRDVLLVGVGDYFELWGREKKEAAMQADLARWKDALGAESPAQKEQDRENINGLLL